MGETSQLPTKLFWIDLEMTGLDPVHDVILEVGAIITDFDFKELVRYEQHVSQPKDLVLERMEANPWWREQLDNRGEFLSRLAGGKSLGVVEQELCELVRIQFGDEPAILAGNSIHMDRLFIRQHMPAFDQLLHYRMLDVTSFKILMQGKYGVSFDKKEAHRALGDIQESIAELQHYLTK
jgi:oligoribonuclease